MPRVLPVARVTLPLRGLRAYHYQRTAAHQHQGIDLPAPEGSLVRAADAGVVEWATDAWRQGFTGYGRVVVLRHAPDAPGEVPVRTLYAHLQAAAVAQGQTVRAGEIIGTVGRTRYTRDDHWALFDSSGAHLHFEVRRGAYPVASGATRMNPIAWLREGETAPAAADESPASDDDEPGPAAPDGALLVAALVALIALATLA
jgi:murein DD-endopeptidase MepM/ murein hydrolase activator NlpD